MGISTKVPTQLNICEMQAFISDQTLCYREKWYSRDSSRKKASLSLNSPTSSSKPVISFIFSIPMQVVTITLQNCRLQIGGSDQWGNIVGGVELIRRIERQEAFGLTVPLLTSASGQKIGKSAGNALWIDGSAFQLYQYLYNLSDSDASALLSKLTLIPTEYCVMLTNQTNLEQRRPQKELALWITDLLFGKKGLGSVKTIFVFFQKNFDSNIKNMSAQQANQLFDGCERHALSPSELQTLDVLTLAMKHGLSSSKAEIRRIMKGDGVRGCGQVIKENSKLSELSLIGERYITLRIGKKVVLVEVQN